MSSITSNSRMIYAFSRDGAVPFHATWHRLDRGRTPRNAIILSAVCAFILAAPTVVNYTAYLAVTSIATIGLYIAYALPILLRLMSKNFKPGPWHLPITATNFNYTPVVVLGTLLIITIWWFASARNWFRGPVIQGSEAELEAIEESVGETVHVEAGGAAGGQ
ncbi:MAG: hypothetical protein AUG82_08220 [Ktedonobacter sp. 13_1_20CM_4_53_11]|nr:MAG: hypothetical protein AUG82_08220 [Ktedonobacter sp. 13_1_20CM_4_53_11]